MMITPSWEQTRRVNVCGLRVQIIQVPQIASLN